MFTAPRFRCYFGFKDSLGARASEMKFQTAGLQKSTHSETGQKVKSFLRDGQCISFLDGVRKALYHINMQLAFERQALKDKNMERELS